MWQTCSSEVPELEPLGHARLKRKIKTKIKIKDEGIPSVTLVETPLTPERTGTWSSYHTCTLQVS